MDNRQMAGRLWAVDVTVKIAQTAPEWPPQLHGLVRAQFLPAANGCAYRS